MSSPIIALTLRISFNLFVTCALVCLISTAYLFIFRLRQTNEALQHPYLKRAPFDRMPMSWRMGILLDYFLRLAFPKSRIWLAGHANDLLAHVDPKKVPVRTKWPLFGMWGGCLLGLPAMIVMWVLVITAGASL